MAVKKVRAKAIYRKLSKNYPNVRCELDYNSPFQLLVATVLSAQCTDKRVNQTTPALFKKYPTAKKMSGADIKDIQRLVKSTGFYRAKAKNIKGLSNQIMDDFDRHKKLMLAIDKVFNENADLLDNIASDYDENGKPYWDERA